MVGSPTTCSASTTATTPTPRVPPCGPAGSAGDRGRAGVLLRPAGLPHSGEHTGRSGGPFIAVGIPSEVSSPGAEGIKTEQQAQACGGVAGESFDPCYHQACDELTPVQDGANADLYTTLGDSYTLVGNVNKFALTHSTKAVSHTWRRSPRLPSVASSGVGLVDHHRRRQYPLTIRLSPAANRRWWSPEVYSVSSLRADRQVGPSRRTGSGPSTRVTRLGRGY